MGILSLESIIDIIGNVYPLQILFFELENGDIDAGLLGLSLHKVILLESFDLGGF